MVQLALADPVRDGLAEQIAPLAQFDAEIAARWAIQVDLERAAERTRAGLRAYDPSPVVESAGDLEEPFVRATLALEHAGLATNREGALARDRRRVIPVLIGAWLAGGVAPRDRAKVVAHTAAAIVGGSILRRASDEVRAGVDLVRWQGATCPCCGGPPDIALAATAERTLLCSRCNATWSFGMPGCIECGAADEPTFQRIPAESIGYRLSICNACGRYLKECELGPPIDPLLERLLTAELDEAAERRGLRI